MGLQKVLTLGEIAFVVFWLYTCVGTSNLDHLPRGSGGGDGADESGGIKSSQSNDASVNFTNSIRNGDAKDETPDDARFDASIIKDADTGVDTAYNDATLSDARIIVSDGSTPSDDSCARIHSYDGVCDPKCASFDPDCSSPLVRCGGKTGTTCSPDQYCAFPSAQPCGGGYLEGVCQPRPISCEPLNFPVCGCNLQTYHIPCLAAMAGINPAYPGKCEGPRADCCTGDQDCVNSKAIGIQVKCIEGVCKWNTGIPGECWTNVDCPPDKSCEGAGVCPCGASCFIGDRPGHCETRAGCCSSDKECEQKSVCINNVCKPPNNTPGECWTDFDCPSGQVCNGISVCGCGDACDNPDKPGVCIDFPNSCQEGILRMCRRPGYQRAIGT